VRYKIVKNKYLLRGDPSPIIPSLTNKYATGKLYMISIVGVEYLFARLSINGLKS